MSLNDPSPLHEEILEEIRRAGPFASIDELNRRVAARAQAWNARPQADLGGLSPDQMVELFKLLVRRRGLVTSKHGRLLLEEQHAGRLYALLVLTFFRTFDLRFLDNSDRHPGLQATVAYTFYRLRSEAHDWSTPQSLAERAWHPDAKEPPAPSDLQYGDMRHWSFTHRVVTPLVQFGLMERRAVDPAVRWKDHEYRIAPLFNRFVRFQFGG